MEEDEAMYTTLEKLLYLQRIPLFSEVPPEHLVALARSARVERVPAEGAVFSVGDPGDGLYFIIEGRVRVCAPEAEPATFVEGDVFGELSVLDSAPRTAAATASTDAVLLRIAQEDFYEVLHGTSELAEGVIHVLVRRLRASTPSG
jgi:CRP-like cAMP-binding protein